MARLPVICEVESVIEQLIGIFPDLFMLLLLYGSMAFIIWVLYYTLTNLD